MSVLSDHHPFHPVSCGNTCTPESEHYLDLLFQQPSDRSSRARRCGDSCWNLYHGDKIICNSREMVGYFVFVVLAEPGLGLNIDLWGRTLKSTIIYGLPWNVAFMVRGEGLLMTLVLPWFFISHYLPRDEKGTFTAHACGLSIMKCTDFSDPLSFYLLPT